MRAALGAVATEPGLDRARLERDAGSRATTRKILRDAGLARAAGVSGTPTFEVGRTGGRLHLVTITSLRPDGLRPALNAALADG